MLVRPRRRLRAATVRRASAALVVSGAVVLAGCGHQSGGTAASSSSAPTAPSTPAPPPTTPPTTAKPSPPTTLWAPTAPQPTAADAAAQLVDAWGLGDRHLAGTVASPAAVDTLFAVSYPGDGLAISRGCSSAFPPLVCTYGPPGGASPTLPIFEVYLDHAAGGWYVTSVTILS